ncbi:MAG: EAL domain-containing protein [Nitrospirae bacterium]|jgi:diguanylate cyclase (GGDEF)-like protein/PAS domain S-box-containing protein|nr:EAL domain-containing protein [Nitrospirota bacterium]
MDDAAALNRNAGTGPPSFDDIGEFARRVFDTCEAGVGVVDAASGRYVFANTRWCEMLGYDREELIRLSVRDVTHPDDWEATKSCVKEASEGSREKYFIEKRFVRKDGSVFWGFLLVRVFRDPVTGDRLLNGIVLDFDEKKRIEFQLLNERNITRALSEINALILKRPSPEELYRESCRIAVEFGGFMASWVAVVDPDTLDTHKSGLYIKDPRVQEGIDRVIISVDPEKPNGRGSVGQAYRTGKPVVLNDYLENPSTLPWQKEARMFGVASAAAFPIRKGQDIVALLVILSNRANFFETESVGLLSRIAEAMSYALDDFERGQDLFLTSLVVDAVPEGIFITDTRGRITRVNEAFCRLSGFSFADLLGQEADMLTEGLEKGVLCSSIRESVEQRGTVEGIFELVRKDRSPYMVEATITLVEEPGRESRHVVLLLKDVTAKMEREKQIWRLANIDDLTGLLNRTALIERLATEMEKSRRKEEALALFFLDFDDFKGINDTLGHSAGDWFLRVIGNRLSSSFRPTDIVARLGGDEFVVVVALESDEHILAFAQKILDILGAPVSIQSQTVQTSVSVGIATFPRDASSVEDLLRKADIAMYQAKGKGKNTWQFFNLAMEERIRVRFEQEQMLKTGLQEGAFFLHFQPQVDVFRNRLVGVEALARWPGPVGGTIGPSTFIPLAEETGTILAFGEWVLQEAFRVIQVWSEAGRPRIRMGVNVSSRQFWSPTFWTFLREILSRHSELTRWLTFELTETVLMRDPDMAGEQLAWLKDLGIRIAIDDFGTGYSSLTYLSRFPVDEIKVSQDFVIRMAKSPRDLKLVKTIIQMGKSLRLNLVGEGAETEEEVRMLEALGCHVIQGFALSRPLPMEEVEVYWDRFREGV